MKVLICPDKFKGSLSAAQACGAIARGLASSDPSVDVVLHPLADGGDGLLDILKEHLDLEGREIEVKDPLSRPIRARYCLARTGRTAYLEMSKASGLVLLAEDERNCLHTSSFGTGELISDALDQGVERIVLGVGGSATNDAGSGMAAALGYRFLDANGNELSPVGENLSRIATIDDSGLDSRLAQLRIDIASDVSNPFYGPQGAAWIFGPQKGADEMAVRDLDLGLTHFADLVHAKTGIDLQSIPGSGAAGGLAGGVIALLGGKIHSGIDMVIEMSGLPAKLADVDWVITGEGMLDGQSLDGKVVDGVLRCTSNRGIATAVLCGACELSEPDRLAAGILQCRQIMEQTDSVQDAMASAERYLELCASQLMQDLIN